MGAVVLFIFIAIIPLGSAILLLAWYIAHSRKLGEQSARIDHLEQELGDTRRRLDALRDQGRPLAHPEPAVEVEEVEAPEPEPMPEALPVAEEAARTLPEAPEPAVPAPLVPVGDPEVILPDPEPGDDQTEGREIDWERWLGVRGAAIVGGLVMGLAAIFLFRYAVEQGLLSPMIRIAMGAVGGLIAIIAGDLLRRRDLGPAAAALAGAGITALYATVWAAHRLYEFMGQLPAFGLLALVTLLCGWLSLRHRNVLVAALGLLGGFATPILVVSEAYQPTGLFIYLALLNVGVLFLSGKLRVPALSIVALFATVAFQVAHLLLIDEQLGVLDLVILAGFAPLFSVFAKGDEKTATIMRTLAWVSSAGLAIFYALAHGQQVDWGSVWILLIFLALGSVWTSHRFAIAGPAIGGALGVGVVFLSCTGNWSEQADLVPVMAQILAVVLCFGLPVLLLGDRPRYAEDDGEEKRDRPSLAPAALVVEMAAVVAGFTVLWSPEDSRSWPWLLLWVPIVVLTGLHGRHERARAGYFLAGLVAGLPPAYLHLRSFTEGGSEHLITLAVSVLVAVGLHGFRLTETRTQGVRMARRGAAFAGCALFAAMMIEDPGTGYGPILLFALVPLASALWAARSDPRGRGLFAIAFTVFLSHLVATWDQVWAWTHVKWICSMVAMTAIVFFPHVSKLKKTGMWTLLTAVLAGPIWIVALDADWDTGSWQSIVSGVVAAVLCFVAARLYRGPDREAMRDQWYAAGVVCMVQWVPLIVGIEPFTEQAWWIMTCASIAAVCAVLGTKRAGTGTLTAAWFFLLGCAFVRFFSSEIFDSSFSYAALVGHLIEPAWLVPIIVCGAAAGYLARSGAQRGLIWAFGLVGLVFVFAWVNIAVSHLFAVDTTLVGAEYRLLTMDLCRSLAWLLLAAVVLVIGFRTDHAGVRRTGLAVLILALSKICLYDVSRLTDLFRVGSLFALALLLIAVSVVYRRLER